MTFIGYLLSVGHCVAAEDPVLILVPSKADSETRSKKQMVYSGEYKGSTSEGMRKVRQKRKKSQ